MLVSLLGPVQPATSARTKIDTIEMNLDILLLLLSARVKYYIAEAFTLKSQNLSLVLRILSFGDKMAEKQNVFVMKDRVEGLEKLVDKVLKVDGLHELAKDITNEVITKAVNDSKAELARIVVESADAFLNEKNSVKIEADARFDFAKTEFQAALVEHIESVEARVATVELKAKAAIAIASISMIVSAVLRFL